MEFSINFNYKVCCLKLSLIFFEEMILIEWNFLFQIHEKLDFFKIFHVSNKNIHVEIFHPQSVLDLFSFQRIQNISKEFFCITYSRRFLKVSNLKLSKFSTTSCGDFINSRYDKRRVP